MLYWPILLTFCGRVPGVWACLSALLSSPLHFSFSHVGVWPGLMEPPGLAWLGLGQSCRSQVFISLELELTQWGNCYFHPTPPHITFLQVSCPVRADLGSVQCQCSEKCKQGRIELCRKVYFSNNENNPSKSLWTDSQRAGSWHYGKLRFHWKKRNANV